MSAGGRIEGTKYSQLGNGQSAISDNIMLKVDIFGIF